MEREPKEVKKKFIWTDYSLPYDTITPFEHTWSKLDSVREILETQFKELSNTKEVKDLFDYCKAIEEGEVMDLHEWHVMLQKVQHLIETKQANN